MTSRSSPLEVAETTESFNNTIQEIVSQVCKSSNVRNVFGEPVTRDDVTIIPVASIVVGFGAGAGAGSGSRPSDDAEKGGGMGLGGGFIMQPSGVWEITKSGARFRRAEPVGLFSSLLEAAITLVRRRLQR
ncbi:MAG TPA: spore germination protein GerW family protein [Polyangiales bacterium]|nr:spore germination protein GerW family protein [Polyangiales bacterium]